MAKASNKLLQRAQLLKILNKYREDSKIGEKEFQCDVEKIAKMDNQDFVCKTLFNEISSPKCHYSNVCAVFAIKSIKPEIFEVQALNYLKNENIEDVKKIFIMSLIKEKGIEFHFEEIANYIDSSEQLAHGGAIEFLSNAITEAEVQIDLLDFFVNLPDSERNDFIQRLTDEFEGDNLANAFSVLIQTDLNEEEFNIISNALLNVDSFYSIEGLKYLSNDLKISKKQASKFRKKYLELQSKYPNEQQKLFVNSIPFKAYISFVDGNSNFSLIFSRIRTDGFVHALLLTLNVTQGITSCMGFEAISLENFTSIIKRLFDDSAPVEISFDEFKAIFDVYSIKTIENDNKLPYELIVWKNILFDVKTPITDLSEYICSNLKPCTLTTGKLNKLLKSKLFETWYYSKNDNIYFDEIVKYIEQNHVVDLDEIDKFSTKTLDKIFKDDEFVLELKKKLLLLSFVAKTAKLDSTSESLYSLIKKDEYLKKIILSILDKSVYYYFQEQIAEDENNVFIKKEKPIFTNNEIEILMSQLEEKWN